MAVARVVAAVAVAAVLAVVALVAVNMSGEEAPLVSVVMVTYERPAFVARALQNIREQDYPRIEVVVVDDSEQSQLEGEYASAVEGADITYVHLDERASIGQKRNLAVAHATGDIVVTWDDDDLFRSHRISKQVEPIVAGRADMTALAHGTYLFVNGMQFFQWKDMSSEDQSPHFGTLAFHARVGRELGVSYPTTSFGEDYGFAEAAMDAGARHETVDNSDGTFVYVRHSNTWVMDKGVEAGVMRNLELTEVPEWISEGDLAFYAGVASGAAAPRDPVNYVQPENLHGKYEELQLKLFDHQGRRLMTGYSYGYGYSGYPGYPTGPAPTCPPEQSRFLQIVAAGIPTGFVGTNAGPDADSAVIYSFMFSTELPALENGMPWQIRAAVYKAEDVAAESDPTAQDLFDPAPGSVWSKPVRSAGMELPSAAAATPTTIAIEPLPFLDNTPYVVYVTAGWMHGDTVCPYPVAKAPFTPMMTCELMLEGPMETDTEMEGFSAEGARALVMDFRKAFAEDGSLSGSASGSSESGPLPFPIKGWVEIYPSAAVGTDSSNTPSVSDIFQGTWGNSYPRVARATADIDPLGSPEDMPVLHFSLGVQPEMSYTLYAVLYLGVCPVAFTQAPAVTTPSACPSPPPGLLFTPTASVPVPGRTSRANFEMKWDGSPVDIDLQPLLDQGAAGPAFYTAGAMAIPAAVFSSPPPGFPPLSFDTPLNCLADSHCLSGSCTNFLCEAGQEDPNFDAFSAIFGAYMAVADDSVIVPVANGAPMELSGMFKGLDAATPYAYLGAVWFDSTAYNAAGTIPFQVAFCEPSVDPTSGVGSLALGGSMTNMCESDVASTTSASTIIDDTDSLDISGSLNKALLYGEKDNVTANYFVFRSSQLEGKPAPSGSDLVTGASGIPTPEYTFKQDVDGLSASHRPDGLANGVLYTTAVVFTTDSCISTVVFAEARVQHKTPITTTLSASGLDGDVFNSHKLQVTATFANPEPFGAARGLSASDFTVTSSSAEVSTEMENDPDNESATWVLTLTLASPLEISDIVVSLDTSNMLPAGVQAPADLTLIYAPPQVTLSSSLGASGIDFSAETVSFTAVFDQDVTGMSPAAFNLQSLGMSVTPTMTTVDARTYVLTVAITSANPGTLSVQLLDGQDGVLPAPSETDKFVLHYKPPTATITSSAGASNSQDTPDVSFTITFSAPVSGFTASSLTFTSDVTPASTPTFTGGDNSNVFVYSVSLTEGVSANLELSVDKQVAGVTPRTGSGDSLSVAYAPPSVDLSAPATSGSNVITFTAVFSTPVAGVTVGDFGLSTTGTGANLASASGTTDHADSEWRVTVTLPAGVATTLTAQFGRASGSIAPPNQAGTLASVVYAPPTPTLTAAATTSDDVIEVTATFNKATIGGLSPVSGVTADTFVVSTDGPTFTKTGVVSSSGGAVYVLTLTMDQPLADGTLRVSIAAGSAGVTPPPAAGAEISIAFTSATVVVGATTAGDSPVAIANGETAQGLGAKLTASFSESGTTNLDASDFGLQLWSYLEQGAVSTYSLAGNVLSLDFGSSTHKLAAVGVQSDFVESGVDPAVRPATNLAFTLACAGTASECGYDMLFTTEDSVVLDATQYFSTPDSIPSTDLSYTWTDASGSAAGTSANTLGKLAAGSSTVTVRVADAPNSARFHDVQFNVKVYSLVLAAVTGAQNAGSSFTASWTSALPTGTTVILELLHNGNVVASTTIADASTKLSAKVAVPATLATGVYNLRARAVPTAALTGDNGDLAVVSTVTVSVKNPFEVSTGVFGACSAACGTGTRTRSVTCVDSSTTPAKVVANKFCTDMGLEFPAAEVDCFLKACVAPTWKYEAWGACSKQKCGFGTQTRSAVCYGRDGVTVLTGDDEAQCGDKTEPVERGCNEFACPTYEWVAFSYGKCSADCGTATRSRFVACRQTGKVAFVADSFCANAGAKPVTTEDCTGLPSCSSPFYRYGIWEVCNAKCGGGESTRTATCYTDSNTQAADEAPCADLTKEATTRMCNTHLCYSLLRSPFGACDAECGGGVAARSLSCVSYLGVASPLQSCQDAGIAIPATTKPCNQQECPKAFCDNQGCSGHGSCEVDSADPLLGSCRCGNQYEGEFCQSGKECGAGTTLLSDGSCCAGDLNEDGSCCESALHDVNKQCCAVGEKINGCGLCAPAGEVAKELDSNGKCCAASERDGSDNCCDGVLDACMICNGDGSCDRSVTMSTSTSYNTVEEVLGSSLPTEISTAVKKNSGLEGTDAEVNVEFNLVDNAGSASGSGSGRLLAAGRRLAEFETTVTVTPGTDAFDAGIMGALSEATQPAAMNAEVSGLTVTSSSPPAVTPVCGNNACEVGELCGATDEACCISDCPVRRIECPTTQTAVGACNDKGVCDTTEGACLCLEGYTGEKCDTCAGGFALVDGKCVRFVVQAAVANETGVEPPCEGLACSTFALLDKLSGAAIALIVFVCLIAFVLVIVMCKWMVFGFKPEDDMSPEMSNIKAADLNKRSFTMA